MPTMVVLVTTEIHYSFTYFDKEHNLFCIKYRSKALENTAIHPVVYKE